MPNVPYLAQPYNMNLVQPNLMDGVNAGLKAFGVGASIAEGMETKKRKRTTDRLLAKWSREGRTVPNMEEATKAGGLDNDRVKEWTTLSGMQAKGDANWMRDVAILGNDYLPELRKIPPKDRIPFIQSYMDALGNNRPSQQSAIKMINQQLGIIPKSSDTGEPMITDDAIDRVFGDIQRMLKFDQARRTGMKNRKSDWGNLTPSERLMRMQEMYHPSRLAAMSNKTKFFMLFDKVLKKGDLDFLPNWDEVETRDAMSPLPSPDQVLSGNGQAGNARSSRPEEGVDAEDVPLAQLAERDMDTASDSVISWLMQEGEQFGQRLESAIKNAPEDTADAADAVKQFFKDPSLIGKIKDGGEQIGQEIGKEVDFYKGAAKQFFSEDPWELGQTMTEEDISTLPERRGGDGEKKDPSLIGKIKDGGEQIGQEIGKEVDLYKGAVSELIGKIKDGGEQFGQEIGKEVDFYKGAVSELIDKIKDGGEQFGQEIGKEVDLYKGAVSDAAGAAKNVPDDIVTKAKEFLASWDDDQAATEKKEKTAEQAPKDYAAAQDAAKSIRGFEDFSESRYPDNKGQSIGYGHNVTLNRKTFKDGSQIPDKITTRQAERLLREDLEDAQASAKSVAGDTLWQKLSLKRKSVLIQLSYQMGGGNLRKFDKMLEALGREDYEAAAREIGSSKMGRKQTPARARALMKAMKEG